MSGLLDQDLGSPKPVLLFLVMVTLALCQLPRVTGLGCHVLRVLREELMGNPQAWPRSFLLCCGFCTHRAAACAHTRGGDTEAQPLGVRPVGRCGCPPGGLGRPVCTRHARRPRDKHRPAGGHRPHVGSTRAWCPRTHVHRCRALRGWALFQAHLLCSGPFLQTS